MSYTIGQKHFVKDPAQPVPDGIFATLKTQGTTDIVRGMDINVYDDEEGTEFHFDDVYVKLTNEVFKENIVYYLHAKVKRLNSEQIFNIKLFNLDEEGDEKVEQQVRTIQIKAYADNEEDPEVEIPDQQVDVEFIFCPYQDFEALKFEMKRNGSDFVGGLEGGRKAIIGFEEISQINNYPLKEDVDKYIKIGIQSRPGLLTCINGEEIHLPRSGMQEIRDGIIYVNFFSVVSPAQELNNELRDWMNSKPTTSAVFLDQPKNRQIDTFTVDFIYEINDGGN